MMFYTRISCDPPLRQSTVVVHGEDQAKFTILLETNEDTEIEDWEVDLWHNFTDDQEWKALNLSSITEREHVKPLVVRRDINQYRKHFFFGGTLWKDHQDWTSREFTVRYRRSGRDWIWANAASNISNGEIIYQPLSLPISEDLSDSFSKFTTAASTKSIRSEVSDTKLWSLEFETAAATTQSVIQDSLLGVPLYVGRWWALVREWAPWLKPAHGHGVFAVQADAVTVSFQRRDGMNLVVLALSGIDDVQTVFRDDDFGGIIVRARNDSPAPKPARVLVGMGKSHESAFAACIYAARNLIQRGSLVAKDTSVKFKHDDDLRANWYSSWTDGLGYCTWNGLGQKLHEDKIFDALHTLKANNVNIQTLIIDDNWQTLDQSSSDPHYHTWTDFEANKEGFPNGLGSTVSQIRDQNPSIKHVSVWHAMFGYWGGITPDGAIAQKYGTKQINRMETGRKGFEAAKLTVVVAEDIQRLYDDFYSFLDKTGVDSVKTDAQMMLDLVDDPEDRRTLIKAYQNAWILSGLQYFQDRPISCMSQYPSNIFRTLLPTNRPAITLRNSDDFWPNIPDSHPWHIFVNAHTSLLTQHLNTIPDWDMFQTTHEFGSFHAAARCISGGPIYITDEPGKHDFDLIKQMTAETVQGTTVILRPSVVARAVSSSIYIGNKEPHLLKIGAYHGNSTTGSSILGVFNCTEGPLVELIHLRNFRGAQPGQKYIIRSYTSGDISSPITLAGEVAVVSVDLGVRGWEILTAFPISTYTQNEKSIDLVPLGLINKLSGAAALLDYKVKPDSGQRLYLSVTLKALGLLGIYISNLESKTIAEDFIVSIYESVIPIQTVTINKNVLEIDVEAAWKGIDEPPSWSNEVTLDIYIAW